ncbi:hypothetical protein HPP92_023281 [Vanilla planifolia]|uniref:Uncharacterized protein n=1 Tax=Vanilla planifolia TaxID=51239 RepID=A0A835UCP8_VANPL|nr:hypothetical protein HPP92_023281 [Vanilla planifolia]
MDPKALAKAKRSHSQHGRRNHPTPSAVAQKKKAAQAESEDKVQRLRFHELPSNWGRYDGGEEEAESSSSTASAEGEVVRKSKGADFSYLIEQARSKQDENRNLAAPKSSSLFEDIPLDFMQGVSSTCVSRGKNLLSRCQNDNFYVDDDLTPNYEVPFLTLDLHALATQLSRIKLSERLFIEADLLPEDPCSDDSKGTTAQTERIEVDEVRYNLNPTDSSPRHSPVMDSGGQAKDHSSAISIINVNLGKMSDRREDAEFTTLLDQGSSSKKGAAEAELDMLLESFGETHLSDSKKPISNFSSDQKRPAEAELDMLLDSSFSFIPGSLLGDSSFNGAPNHDPTGQISRDQTHFTSNRAVIDSLDVSLDDLLEETSTTKEFHRQKSGIGPISIRNISPPLSKSGSSSSVDHSLASRATMDDFDSWFDTLG